MELKLYIAEVGVLLEKTNEEYDDYNQVYGGRNSFYEGNNAAFLTLDEAKKYAKRYVDKGVDNTYGVVKQYIHDCLDFSEKHPYVSSFIKEVKRFAWHDDIELEESGYEEDDVIYSIVKHDGVMIEDFVRTDVMSTQNQGSNKSCFSTRHRYAKKQFSKEEGCYCVIKDIVIDGKQKEIGVVRGGFKTLKEAKEAADKEYNAQFKKWSKKTDFLDEYEGRYGEYSMIAVNGHDAYVEEHILVMVDKCC